MIDRVHDAPTSKSCPEAMLPSDAAVASLDGEYKFLPEIGGWLRETQRKLGRFTRRVFCGMASATLVFGCANIASYELEPEQAPELHSAGNGDCSTSDFVVVHTPSTGKNVSQHLEFLNRSFIEQNGGASWVLWYGTEWDAGEIHDMIDEKAKSCNRREKIKMYISTMSLGGKLAQEVANVGDFTYVDFRGLIMSGSAPTSKEVKKTEARIGVEIAADTNTALTFLGRPAVWLSAVDTEIRRNGLGYTITSPAAHKAIEDSTQETNPKILGWQMIQNGKSVTATSTLKEYYIIGSKYDKVVNDVKAHKKWEEILGRSIDSYWVSAEPGVNDSDEHASDWVAHLRDPSRVMPRYDTNQELNYNEAYALIYRRIASGIALEKYHKQLHQDSEYTKVGSAVPR